MIARVPKDMERYVTEYIEMARAQITEALQPGPPVRFRTLGHNLKGSAPSFGLTELGRLGAALEAAAIAENQSALEDAIDALQTWLADVRIEFE